MARVKHDNNDDSKDISKYTDLGEMHWREALEKAYSPGIDTVAVCPEMMHIRGIKRLIPRHKTRDKVMVVYDREYVLYRMYTLFAKKLNIVVDGKFDDVKYTVITNGLKEYSLNEFKREHEKQIRSQAEILDIKFPGKGLQHWISVLSDDVKEGKKEDDTTKADNAIAVDDNDAAEEDITSSNIKGATQEQAIKDETTTSDNENKVDAVVSEGIILNTLNVKGTTENEAITDATTTAIDDVGIHSNEALQADIDVTNVTTNKEKVDDGCIENVVVGVVDDSDIESDIVTIDNDATKEERKKRGRPRKQE